MPFWFLFVFVVLTWSTNASVVKQMVILCENNPFMVAAAYNVIATLVTLVIAWIRKEPQSLKEVGPGKKFPLLVLLNGSYDIAFVLAINFAETVQFAILANYLWPLFLVVFLGWIKKQPFSPHALIGCVLGFLGVAVVFFPSSTAHMEANALGVGFGIVAALLWSLYSALLEKKHDRVRFLLQGLAQSISATFAVILASALGRLSLKDISSFKSGALILVYSILNMSMAYSIWIEVANRLKQKSASALYVIPVLSVGIAGVWFGQLLDPMVVIATLLVLCGIVVSRLKTRKG